MKSLLFISVLIGVSLLKADTTARNKENAFLEMFEMLREVIVNGAPVAGIPILDPYKLEYAHFYLPADMFSISANITDAVFLGLSGFEIRKFNFSLEESTYIIEFDVFFPALMFFADYYEMEGIIEDVIPLAGEGVIHIEVHDLNIWSKIYVNVGEDAILVDRFDDPGFSVSRIMSKTEYDRNIDDIANTMVEELLADYLTRFNKYIAMTYSHLIVDALNAVLSKDSWRTLVE